MRHLVFGALAGLAALAMTPASAADLGQKPVYKAPAVPTAYNWSGFYLGIQGGYGWGDGDLNVPTFATASRNVSGWFGGGTIGWNWQAAGSPWVWGIEADFSGSNIDHHDTPFFGVIDSKVNSFGTARARIGYAVDPALWYITGGFAWADHDVTVTIPGIGFAASESNTHSGWTIGAGVEWALVENWSAKVEYLFMDFGSDSVFNNFNLGVIDVDAQIHTVKVGLNYRFGGGKAPVVARY